MAEKPGKQDSLEQSYGDRFINDWLTLAGFSFNPFNLLEASKDAYLSSYLIEHHAFSVAWGDWHSFVFAPPGGGKTALRARVAQACWVGQEVNRPFPIPYAFPFLTWGHTSPALNDHFDALSESTAQVLLLTLAHRPYWFIRLKEEDKKKVRFMLDLCLPGPVESYLQACLESSSLAPLQAGFPPAFIPANTVETKAVFDFCREILDIQSVNMPVFSPREKWDGLLDILLRVLEVPEVFVLVDGLDGTFETAADPNLAHQILKPLLDEIETWGKQRIYLKSFLPLELSGLISKKHMPGNTQSIILDWTPDLLAQVIRKRVYVSTQGMYGGLSPFCEPGLTDIELKLAQEVLPLPREILVITQRLLIEQQVRQSDTPRIIQEDLDKTIGWYHQNKPEFF